MNYAYTLMVQACTVTVLLCLEAGYEWVDTGYGIHPIVAGALATLFFLLPHLVAKQVLK